MSDLFNQDDFKPIDIMSIAARQKHGLPSAWCWVQSEAITGGILLDGCIPDESKPRNRGRYPRPWQKVIITTEDLETARIAWERERNKCFECQGMGSEVYGHSIQSGWMRRPCVKCSATGKPTRSGIEAARR